MFVEPLQIRRRGSREWRVAGRKMRGYLAWSRLVCRVRLVDDIRDHAAHHVTVLREMTMADVSDHPVGSDGESNRFAGSDKYTRHQADSVPRKVVNLSRNDLRGRENAQFHGEFVRDRV